MYKTFSIFFIFLFFAASSFAQETEMNSSEISKFKSQVERQSKKTTAVQADFVQYKHLDFLSNDIETVGKLIFKAPNSVKWQYVKPYEYRVIFKDDRLLINDGGKKSKIDIGNNKLFSKMNELIVNSVTGNMFDESQFDIKYQKTSQFNRAIFLPKDGKLAGYIAAFEISFNKNSGEVEEVKMVEPSKDFTRIVFKNRKINNPINDAVFSN